MTDPAYRVIREDPEGIIHGYELRELPGRVMLLKIQTIYKHPTIQDAPDGVNVVFGNMEAMVRVIGLTTLYQTWAEPSRYGVFVVMVPVDLLTVKPIYQEAFPTALQVLGQEEADDSAE